MSDIIRMTAHDGTPVEFVDQIRSAGGLKDCYFSPDRSYVVLWFRASLDAAGKERLAQIVTRFRDGIFNQVGGEYWRDLFCWPERLVEYSGRSGITCPVYPRHFFFEHGSKRSDMLGIRGREKEGKWFASANNRSKYLDPRELGDWATHLRICLLLSRAVRRMHMAGLAHSDLSYKNVLVDPVGGNACVIDIDSLVVPGKYPPDVIGTPDFIAPEVVATARLSKHDPRRALPSIATDCHALAVLIYMYLLYRHPLRGGKVHDAEPTRDEELGMGERALFIEDPQDASNRVRLADVQGSELPWADTDERPFDLTGPYLTPLFLRAFGPGLLQPRQRPDAADWEQALLKTQDLLLPCANPACEQRWFVFDNSSRPRCTFCRNAYSGVLPVLNLYYATHQPGQFRPENQRLMVYPGQALYPWHVTRNLANNEKLNSEQRQRAGYFVQQEDRWYLVNERIAELRDVTDSQAVAPGSKIELKENTRLLLSKAEGGRLVHVQMVDCRNS